MKKSQLFTLLKKLILMECELVFCFFTLQPYYLIMHIKVNGVRKGDGYIDPGAVPVGRIRLLATLINLDYLQIWPNRAF